MSFLDALAQVVSNIHPDNTDNAMQPPAQAQAQAQSNQPIVVNGAGGQTPDDAPAPNFGNSSYINEADAALENEPVHKGRFGVKGTLRDVLGTIGDAFLVQSGNKSTYDVKRHQEKVGDALSGFSKDPLAAMERLARVDPEAADKLYNDYQTNMYHYGQLKSLDDNRKDMAKDRGYTNLLQGRAQLQRILSAAKTPQQRVALAQTYGPLIAQQAGTTVEDLGLTPGMTDDDLETFAKGDMTVNQQVQVPFTERRVASGEVNAAAHMKNASRPPRPPAPKATTNIQTYVGEDGYQYTERSDGTIHKSTKKVRQKGGTGRRSVSPTTSSGWGSVTRN